MTHTSSKILVKPIAFTRIEIAKIKQALSRLDWSMFLESASLEHVDSQWSIFTADPIATLTESDRQYFFHDFITGTVQSYDTDPLHLQSMIRQQLFHQEAPCDFPFTGGVIAAYNYEMGEKFESLAKSKETVLASPSLHCGFYDWAILFNVKKEQYYLLQHCTKNQHEIITDLWEARHNWLNKLALTCGHNANFSLAEDWSSDCTQDQYTQSFNKIQDYILSGDCYQVNLAQRFQAAYVGDEYQAYQALLRENEAPFAAFIRLPKQVILSVSPERFLLSSCNNIQTKPIKGTIPRSLDPVQDLQNKQILLHSEKDQAENLMIVDLLRNDIGRVSIAGTVSVPDLFSIESFPAVHHLVSTVIGKLAPKYNSEDLIRACFPGGSITGAPKIRSMEIISELERHQRDIYCGSIAYINGNGDMDSSITIRTLVCKDNLIYCWAGGGIVADSKAESEYQECFDKVSKILPVLTQLHK